MDWKKHYRLGCRYNLDEDYASAQKELEKALELCPDGCDSDAGRIIFEIGRSFFGRGMKGIAVKNMLAALKMGAAEDYVGNMMKCLLNGYGMPVQRSAEEDDAAAFTAVHIMRYLSIKRNGRFGSAAEHDMVMDLVSEAWKDFKYNEDISGLSAREKVDRFREYVIIFPTIKVPEDPYDVISSRLVYADFGGNLCSCGSGLPYMWCCGRIKTLDELENGLF